MDLNVPEKITHKESLELLAQDVRGFCQMDLRELDVMGREAWAERNVTKAYYCKVISAKGYEELASNAADARVKIEMMRTAAIVYDKAAKDAVLLGFLQAAIRCRERACKLYHSLYKKYMEEYRRTGNGVYFDKAEQINNHMEYAQEHIIKIIELNSSEDLGNGIEAMNQSYEEYLMHRRQI